VGGGFSPLDEELGLLPKIALTPTLAESVTRLGTWLPFTVAAEMLAHFVHTHLSEATVTRLTERAGAAYEAVQDAQAADLEQEVGPACSLAAHWRAIKEEVGPRIQQVSVDGAMIPLVHQQWVEAKTLVIGTVHPPERQADGTLAIHTTDLSYFSRVADCHTFTQKATIEIVRRGTLSAGTVCGVVDGAAWEQGFLDVHCPAAVRILDWPHGVGYLANVAQALYGADTPAQQAWLAAQRETLLTEDPQVVLAKLRGIRDDLTLQSGEGPPLSALAVVTESLDYLEKRVEQLRYAAFRALGYPIGSGAVESANKLVVEARLKGAGRHWASEHVNPLLALRGMACSDRWAEGWPQLTTQWRTQARAATLEHRRLRQAARQVTATPQPTPPRPIAGESLLAEVGSVPQPPAVSPAPPLPTPPVATAPRTSTVPPLPRRRTPSRPAATHPWRRPFSRPPSHPEL
jgi:hypothetical protein